jgi:hypothetical protein
MPFPLCGERFHTRDLIWPISSLIFLRWSWALVLCRGLLRLVAVTKCSSIYYYYYYLDFIKTFGLFDIFESYSQ